MTFASPWALGLLALAIPVIALHILRPRRAEVVVASTLDWQTVDRPVSSSQPWQRLRWSLPLILQLLLVALLAVAAAGPSIDTGRRSADRLVAIVDTSASMGATDGTPNRLAAARAELAELADGLGDDATVTVIAAGAPATIVASDLEPGRVGAVAEQLTLSEGGFDMEGAVALAQGLDLPDRRVDYALLTDGGLPPGATRFLPAGTEVRLIGSRSMNLGVGNVVVSATGAGQHVQAVITNAGDDDATTVVRVDVDGRTDASRSVSVEGGETVEVGFDVVAGERIDVLLDGDDLLDLDDHAYAVGPDASTVTVLQVGPANPFLDALLGATAGVEVRKVATLAEHSDGAAEEPWQGIDLVVLDRVGTDQSIPVPWVAFDVPGGVGGVSVSGEPVEDPAPALVRGDTPMLAGLSFAELSIARAQRLDAPAATTLIGAEATPLLVSGREAGVPFAYFGFSLEDSNLGLLPAFPVLGERLLTEVGGARRTASTFAVGDRAPVDSGAEAVVTSPSGTRTVVPPGRPAPQLDRAGIWTVESNGTTRRVVVNPDPGESAIAPVEGLAVPGAPPSEAGDGSPVRRSLVLPLLIAALAVLAAETILSARRRGVGVVQWRVAAVMRGAIALALLIAAFAPAIRLQTGRVATVFVVDVSDSMGGAVAAEAVAAALDAAPGDSAAGVVVVGATARVDTAVTDDLKWSMPRVQVEGSATDLAAGVRLAGAIAPTDHARRVVVVSDGRPTVGDLDGEVERLRRAGIRLDVIPIDTTAGPDVAVTAVNAADRARSTDTVTVTVGLTATVAQAATVVLRRDDVEVDRRLVDVPAGASEVRFEQPAGAPGVARWSASVAGPANGVLANDHGRATTRIDDRAEIVLVEGAPDAGAQLADVFRGGGAGVRVVPPEELPDLAGLASLDAVVLVDVPASALSASQVDTLITATKDLGTGLLTVGGTSSYGPGNYLGSQLESLLPVISEVKDPKRRSKVAQVFAVDVSGSMGACHCAEDAAGANRRDRADGGVEKSSIARAAAVAALEGIDAGDELGVLALDDRFRWVRDLAPVGDGSRAREQIEEIDHGDGATNLGPGLTESAKQLRETDAALRHIVLFTDGFEEMGRLQQLALEAAELQKEGITVSVMGTGEGSAAELRSIAEAGGGRFYPGRDLQALPDLLLQETRVVARQQIEEGEFLPEIASNAPEVSTLDSAPPVLGYIATTARPTATRHLLVGAEDDPLLATWQVGLGKVSSWTSDAGGRWAGGWMSWADAPAFWADVLRGIGRQPQGGLDVRFDGDRAEVTVTFDDEIPDGAVVRALVSDPDGATTEHRLDRLDARRFSTTMPTAGAGTYGIGVTATGADRSVLAAVTGTADQAYSREYSAAPSDPELLRVASLATGGRGEITAEQAFDSDELEPGRRAIDLRLPLLIAAALCWPIAVAVSRLRRRPVAQRAAGVAPAQDSSAGSARSGASTGAAVPPGSAPTEPGDSPPPVPPPDPAPTFDAGSPLGSLLESRRRRGEPEDD